MKRMLLASAVSAAAILTASAASATDYTVTNVGLIGGTLNLSGLVTANNQLAGLITLTTDKGVIPTFCVDLFHTINLGTQNYQYTMVPLTVDSNGPIAGVSGNLLTPTQIGEIQSLTDVGVQEFKAGTGDANAYTALQGAIWAVEYPTLNVDGGALNGQIAADITFAQANPLFHNSWSLIPGAGGAAFGPGQALQTASGPNMGEGLLGFAAMTALLIGARFRGLFV
jgi:hypothetical protein